MKATELYKLMQDNQEKLAVIDQICELHPGTGTQVGWSWYHGGMEDTGEWNVKKMLTVPLPILQTQLSNWVQEGIDSKKRNQELKEFEDKCRQEGNMDAYYQKVFGDNWQLLKAWIEKKIPSVSFQLKSEGIDFPKEAEKTITYRIPYQNK